MIWYRFMWLLFPKENALEYNKGQDEITLPHTVIMPYTEWALQ